MSLQVVVPVVIVLVSANFVHGNGTMMLTAINECENYTQQGDIKSTLMMNTTDSKVNLTGSIDLPFAIDDKIMYLVVVYMKMDKEDIWDKLFEMNGSACEGLKMIPKLWTKVSEVANVSHTCPINEGHYELNNFILNPEDADIPLKMIGSFKVEVHVLKDDESVICKQFILQGNN